MSAARVTDITRRRNDRLDVLIPDDGLTIANGDHPDRLELEWILGIRLGGTDAKPPGDQRVKAHLGSLSYLNKNDEARLVLVQKSSNAYSHRQGPDPRAWEPAEFEPYSHWLSSSNTDC